MWRLALLFYAFQQHASIVKLHFDRGNLIVSMLRIVNDETYPRLSWGE
jgi:hypothetical protein